MAASAYETPNESAMSSLSCGEWTFHFHSPIPRVSFDWPPVKMSSVAGVDRVVGRTRGPGRRRCAGGRQGVLEELGPSPDRARRGRADAGRGVQPHLARVEQVVRVGVPVQVDRGEVVGRVRRRPGVVLDRGDRDRVVGRCSSPGTSRRPGCRPGRSRPGAASASSAGVGASGLTALTAFLMTSPGAVPIEVGRVAVGDGRPASRSRSRWRSSRTGPVGAWKATTPAEVYSQISPGSSRLLPSASPLR